jgi:MinD-like ATPase involved in chromosome partitioning or flagellar assembly
MGRLNLVIADGDERYVESLSGYLLWRYPERFNITSFTSPAGLAGCFSGTDIRADILLTSPQMYAAGVPEDRIGIVIFLSDGSKSGDERYFEVKKYQHAGRMAGDILGFFSQTAENRNIPVNGGKRTKIVAVFSPAGGTGKTSVALYSSMLCARKGLSVFYLNMEDIQSTPLFFECGSAKNLSDVLLHVKSQGPNLALKIEAASCTDAELNIQYLSPPESVLELDEMCSEEIGALVRGAMSSCNYDILFIDMSAGLCGRNRVLLENSDEILVVITPDGGSMAKLNALSREFDRLSENTMPGLRKKITLVLNRCTHDMSNECGRYSVMGKTAAVYLPDAGEDVLSGFRNHDTRNSAFTEALEGLARRYYRRR